MIQRPKIVMAVTTDYVTDPRVMRSSTALAEEGYAVRVLARMKRTGVVPVNREGNHGVEVEWMKPCAQKGFAFYAEYNIRLLLKLLRTKADAFYANDTDTLAACYCAARLRRKALIFDAHELFPEVPELMGKKRVKRIWEGIEQHVLSRMPSLKAGALAITVCQSIADYYREKYGIVMTVVRNVPDYFPEWEARKDVSNILLYQGAVNKGRGVLKLMDAMECLPEYRLVVVGDGDEWAELRDYCATLAWRDRIELVGRKRPEELRLWTEKAALGLVLMEPMGLSYYYSLPNRVGEFAVAGVPILASDYPEIARVVNEYRLGRLVDCSKGIPQGQQLADEVRATLSDWQSVDASVHQANIARVHTELSWQHDRPIFLSSVNSLFT